MKQRHRSGRRLRGFEVAGAWQSARTVSGDYYDVLRLSDHKLGICTADVTGKGASAAPLMANVRASVRAYAGVAMSPAEVSTRGNSLLRENIATGKFVTCPYAILDGAERSFRYCNAGHLHLILVHDGSTATPDHNGAVLGVSPPWNYEDLEDQP